MKQRPAGEQAIEGRVAIAQALGGIMGVPVSTQQVDRLRDARKNPLPVHGRARWRWAFLSELQEWWAEADECGKSEDAAQ